MVGIRRPDDSGFSQAEWDLLSAHPHPVATSAEVDDGPVRTVLLDVALVAWRDPTGTVVVAPDRCPHRGSRLSTGRYEDGVLACPYHGLRFGEAGRCAGIPFAEPGEPLPAGLHLGTVAAEERYGLVWVRLTDDDAPLPDWSALEAPGRQRGSCWPEIWQASALRHAENFNDLAHFAFVHTGTFASPVPNVPPIEVEADGDVLRSTVVMRQLDRLTFDGPEVEVETAYRYTWQLPFASELVIEYPGGRTEWICDVAAPVTASTCRVYVEKARDHDLDQPVGAWIGFQEAVNTEDAAVLAGLEPPAPGLVVTGEVHLRSDVVSVAARRWFRARLADQG